MKKPATKNQLTRQKGAALVVFFMAIILTGAVFLISDLGPDILRSKAENRTSASLAKAKDVLLSYSTSYYLRQSITGNSHAGSHGLLPCPESLTNSNQGRDRGACGSENSSSLGRLPWVTLDIEPLKDSSGECLWYAVSGGFFNSPLSPMTNDDTPGNFQIFNEAGVLSIGTVPEDRVVAVIIAPGKPLPGQTRSAAVNGSPCNVPNTSLNASNYLDSFNSIDNSSVDGVNNDLLEQFITSNGLHDNTSLNDRVITITSNEIFDSIKKNDSIYRNKIQELGIALGNCLIDNAEAGFITDSLATPPGSYCSLFSSCDNTCTNNLNICLSPPNQSDEEITACYESLIVCEANCRDSCITAIGSSPPVPPAIYKLPWPALVDLPADYRLNVSYTDLNSAPIGRLGRLPFNTPRSRTDSGDSLGADIFATCNLENLNPELFLLWENWKDHWFYVVGVDFSPLATATPPTPCAAGCPKLNAQTNAAILIFSNDRVNGQLRRSNETENPDPALANSKADISNYLEGSNSTNYTDPLGNKTYGIGGINTNDRYFCIPENMSTTTECFP